MNVAAPADQTPVDPFLAAFDSLSRLDEGSSQQDVDKAMTAAPTAHEPPADAPQAQEGEQPVQEGQDGEQPTQEGAQPEEEPSPAGEQDKAPAEADADLLARLADLVKKAPAQEQPKPTEQPQEQPKPTEQPQEQPLYSQEEQEFLSTYEKEWPDVARAESLRRRAEYRELVGFVFKEVASYLKPHMEVLDTLATRTHLQELETKVPDYDSVRDAVVEWVGTQPKYLQAAYQHVIEQGTTEEVADLIGRWRVATGQSAQTPAPAKPAKETVLPPATKQAAAALAPVGSKRSAAATGVDPTDFSAAFDAAAASDKV